MRQLLLVKVPEAGIGGEVAVGGEVCIVRNALNELRTTSKPRREQEKGEKNMNTSTAV